MRKLILCMDGTGNEIGDRESNVVKLYRTLAQDEDQLSHYVMGVGTDDSPSTIGSIMNRVKGVLGLAFGLGLEDDVLDAYRWLCRTYVSADQRRKDWKAQHGTTRGMPEFDSDQIYIMGFSRGAYAARVLAGFIHNFGIVGENHLHLVAPVFRAYRGLSHLDDISKRPSKRYQALRHYGLALRPQIAPVRALLLFDTVASMIRFGKPLQSLRRYWSLADLGLHKNVQENASVRIVVQALAVDERRTFFRPLRWFEGKPYFGNRFERTSMERQQYVRQRWFPGFHGDIGGSSREDEAGIGKITALWLLKALREEEAKANAEDLQAVNARLAEKALDPVATIPTLAPGLRFRRFNKKLYFFGEKAGTGLVTNPADMPYSPPDPLAPLHNSVFANGARPSGKWIWLILEVLPPKAWIRRAGGPIAWFRFVWPYYLPLLEPRYIPETHEIDDSVYLRRDSTDYAPKNLTRAAASPPTRWWDAERD